MYYCCHIIFESSVLAWIRIRIEKKCWIRICNKSIRIRNPAEGRIEIKACEIGYYFTLEIA
jgi:hypothetical protein